MRPNERPKDNTFDGRVADIRSARLPDNWGRILQGLLESTVVKALKVVEVELFASWKRRVVGWRLGGYGVI